MKKILAIVTLFSFAVVAVLNLHAVQNHSTSIIEQIYINRYGLHNLQNKINSISPKFWNGLGISPDGSINPTLLNSINRNKPRH